MLNPRKPKVRKKETFSVTFIQKSPTPLVLFLVENGLFRSACVIMTFSRVQSLVLWAGPGWNGLISWALMMTGFQGYIPL